MNLSDALLMTSQHASADGTTPHILLDFFVRASGLQWDTAGEILHERRIVPAGFSTEDIQLVRQAHRFLEGFNEGRVAYAIAVAAQEISAMQGDWALFESPQLAVLLPGLHMPRMLLRDVYAANLVRDRMGLTLDIHAFPSGLPLVRHPL